MSNNFYIKYNYKNIIPFNLKKKKLRVHASLIATNKLQSFLVGHKIKFWYHYFGVNGLKKNNTILMKKFLDKKLSVFFISNFNMIESKWAFPKIYQGYYTKFSYKKKKKFNLIKLGFILNKDYSSYYSNLLINKKKKNLNINSFLLKHIYILNYFNNINIYKNNFIFFKFKKFIFLPILFIQNIRKKRNLKYKKNKYKVYYKNKYKGSYNSEGFLIKYKKRNIIKDYINKLYLISLYKIKKLKFKWKKNWKFDHYNKKNKKNKIKKNKFKLNKNKYLNIILLENKKKLKKLKKLIKLIKLKTKNNKIIKNLKIKKINKIKNNKIIKNLKIKKINKINKINKIKNNKIIKISSKINKIKKKINKIINYKKYLKRKKSWNKRKKINLIKNKKKNKNKKWNKFKYWNKNIFLNSIKKQKIFMFKNKILIKFFVIKKIMNIIQFLKLFKEIKKYFKINICLWFYKCFLKFKYKKIFIKKKNKKKKQKKNIKNIYLNIVKQKKNHNRFKPNNKWLLNINHLNKNNKIWLEYTKNKINKFIFNIKYLNYIIYFNKYINKLYNNKLYNNKYLFINKVNFYNKRNIYYNLLDKIWWKYANYSKIKRLKIIKKKKNKKIKRWFKSKRWIKRNTLSILHAKNILRILKEAKIKGFVGDTIYHLSSNLLKKKFKNYRKKFISKHWKYNIFNYDKLWNKKQKNNIKYPENFNMYNQWSKKLLKPFINKKINNNRNFSIYLYTKNFHKKNLKSKLNNNKYKKDIIKEKRLNKIIKINWNNFNKKFEKNVQLRRWKKENNRLKNIFKEYFFGDYEEIAFYSYLKFLGHYFNKPIKYEFILTNSMKIKTFLWTSPILVKDWETPIIELRTLKERTNDLLLFKLKYRLWKSLKNYRRLPKLIYSSKCYLSINKNNNKNNNNKNNNNKNNNNKNNNNKNNINKNNNNNNKFLNSIKKKKKEKLNYYSNHLEVLVKMKNVDYYFNIIDSKKKIKKYITIKKTILKKKRKIKRKIYVNKKIKNKMKKQSKEYLKIHEIENKQNIQKILGIMLMLKFKNLKMQKWLIKQLSKWNLFKMKDELSNIFSVKNQLKKIIKKKKYLCESKYLKTYLKKKWKKRIHFLRIIISIWLVITKQVHRLRHKFIKSKFLFSWSLWLKFYKQNKFKYRNKKKKKKRKQLKFIQESYFSFKTFK